MKFVGDPWAAGTVFIDNIYFYKPSSVATTPEYNAPSPTYGAGDVISIFSDSYTSVATFLPEGGGYSSIFHGKVVDMLHFPLWEGFLPEWIPFWGGDYFTFFDPVFNVADMSISIGFSLLILFNKKAFPKKLQENPEIISENDN